MPASLLRLALTLGFACCLLVVPRDDTAPPVGAATLPSGFTDSLVVSVSAPTSFAFTPDGRLLVTSQAGRLHVVQNGTLLAVPALDLSAKLCSNGERGLLGIAVDPAFPSNQRLYLYYTLKRGAYDVAVRHEVGAKGATRTVQLVAVSVDGAADQVASIAAVAEENSAATEELSASAEEMTAQVEELTASTHALGAMAQELRDQVAAFQLRGTSGAGGAVVDIESARVARAA